MVLIYIVLIILLLTFILFTVDYIRGLKLGLLANINETGMDVNIKFLYPFFNMVISIRNNVPVYNVNLFKVRIMKGKFIRDTYSNKNFSLMRLIKSVEFSDIDISASYGLNDPYKTGLLYGSLCAAGASSKISMEQNPDFMPEDEYINFNAVANLYLGQTIINFIKNK